MHKLYLFENKNIPETDICLDISKDMYYNTRYRDDPVLRDYIDGFLKLNSGQDCNWDASVEIDKNNVTVLRNTYEKLAYIVFCVLRATYTESRINESLNEHNIIQDIQRYIPDFNGFTFDLLKEQQLGNSRIYMPIDYEDDDEKIYKTGNDYSEWSFIEKYKDFGLNLIDIAIQKKYTIIIDDMDDDYIDRMIEDGIIDKDNFRIISFWDWDKVEEFK